MYGLLLLPKLRLLLLLQCSTFSSFARFPFHDSQVSGVKPVRIGGPGERGGLREAEETVVSERSVGCCEPLASLKHIK